jgi:hypothetical protein
MPGRLRVSFHRASIARPGTRAVVRRRSSGARNDFVELIRDGAVARRSCVLVAERGLRRRVPEPRHELLGQIGRYVRGCS